MADPSITLDPDSLAQIVQKAVLDSITPEARDRLLQDAIKSLLTIPKDDRPPYARTGSPPQSPLMVAFEGAVRHAAAEAVREAVESDPKVQQAIREVVHPLVADLCEGNWTGLPEAIGNAFGLWLQESRR